MAWSVWACDTVTGTRLQKLPQPAAFSWARALNEGSGGSATIPLRAANFAGLNLKSLSTPLARTWVLDWDGSAVYAGIIEDRIYNHKAGTLTLPHSDLWTILDRRLAIDHREPVAKVVHQSFTSLSSATVAKKMTQLGIAGLSDMNMLLPITFSADSSGPITRKYYGYHFAWLGDVLRDLMNEDGGTDIDFRPRWLANKLDWQMRTGSLTSGTFEWHLGVDKSGTIGLTVTEDSSKVATASYAIGEGSEVDKLARSRRVIDPPIPFLDRITALSTEDNEDALTRYAIGDLAAFQKPTEQWGFSTMASGTPAVSDLLLGGSAKTWVQEDPWLSTGWHNNRIIGFSGDLSEKVKLQLQPGVL